MENDQKRPFFDPFLTPFRGVVAEKARLEQPNPQGPENPENHRFDPFLTLFDPFLTPKRVQKGLIRPYKALKGP